MDPGSPDPAAAAAALRRVGLRVTASRLAVLTALAAGAPHSSVDAIVGAVREHLGDGSTQTVYNVLGALIDAGLVRRIEPAGRPGLYELRVGDNHHHIVCRHCDAIVDVDCAVGDTPCLVAADDSGYEIDEAEVIYWGRCPLCAAATSISSGELARTGGEGHRSGHTAIGPAQSGSNAMSHQHEAAREEQHRRV
jgi:Fur family ferric uptake transcriptional regulator